MPILSMTGFARAEGACDGYSWTWEVKSVNARNLDIRFRLPPAHDFLEAHGRRVAPEKFARGNVSAHLALRRSDETSNYRVNRDVLDRMVALAEELRAETGAPPPRIEGLLVLPGVVEAVGEEEEPEAEREKREAAISASLEEAFDRLVAAREEEGSRLATVIAAHLDEIARLCGDASACAEAQPEAILRRLREQLDELLGDKTPVAEERLAQEVALLASRADVREEIDRLDAHVEAARTLLADGGAVGRRLDFLCQEFNREANTLCSKSPDLALTRIGLDLKAAVERLREQIQNVE